MADPYSTRVSATGGRHGTVKNEDGILALALAMPKSLGGPGGATNPEQLFAAGYVACHDSGIRLADPGLEVIGEIGIYRTDSGAFGLSAKLEVTSAGGPGADAICPYSDAIRSCGGDTCQSQVIESDDL